MRILGFKLSIVLMILGSIGCSARHDPETNDLAKLRLGMSQKEIKDIFGRPYLVSKTAASRIWTYALIDSIDPKAEKKLVNIEIRFEKVVDFDGAELVPAKEAIAKVSERSKTKDREFRAPPPEAAPPLEKKAAPIDPDTDKEFREVPKPVDMTPKNPIKPTDPDLAFDWEIHSFKTIEDPSGKCKSKPAEDSGCIVYRCDKGDWVTVCAEDPYGTCGTKPGTSEGCQIGRCVNGMWEQRCT